ncbi:hypothetical protein LUZ61_018402 [Rhynchospora tenuis]|uniref:RING-type domain-containing protein n=1 Tax=Rhynchospora tenuis TaxID=198213 RepID=A0AAD6ELX2_9POAL|nr:hypothetical protein LUZ61_018402 [Rhynchospora tenuis]
MDASISPDLSLLEDFGQRVDLTRRIREVLVNYPEGTTVLKELIQNADDAGATKVCLCLDRRAHGAESVLSPKLAQWQGPALLAYNDAVFTEEDFVSISRIGDSKKQSQAWKTGRFGVGFNSVYHLTDLPSFVSGKYVVLFDPQVAYLPNVSATNPGKRIDYVSSSALKIYHDQFAPYRAFGCDMENTFSGTLFRFPLRNSEQASVSRLSRQAYSENDVLILLSQLYEEVVFTMLFLKSIVLVEMYEWEAGTDAPKRLYSCSVRSPDKDISWHRKALIRFSTSGRSHEWQRDSFTLDFVSEDFSGAKLEKRVSRYFVTQGLASMLSKIGTFASVATKEYDLHLLPWASVAACISDEPQDTKLRQGHAFCFLPLPVLTGLAVQVNGYFEISSNRRDIWFGGDMDRGGKFRSDWNRLLLEDVAAPLFSELLLGLQTKQLPTEIYYSLWPTGSFEGPWALLVQSIYKAIYSSPVLYSLVAGGTWVSPAKAIIHDKDFVRNEELGEALVTAGMPVVHLLKPIISMFSLYYTTSQFKVATPEIVRNFLKGCLGLEKLDKSNKLILLEYCLNDMDDGDNGKDLTGLPLVPLANGCFGVFSFSYEVGSYFICNELEYELLHAVSDQLIDRSIRCNLFDKLSEIASGSHLNVMFMDASSFIQFFSVLFPSGWELKNQVSWNPDLGPTFPTAAWFKLFWQYLGRSSYDLGLFVDWPILPSTAGHLYRPLTFSKLINAEVLSSSLQALLEKMGCKVLDVRYGVEHKQLSLFVHDGDVGGVISSLFERISLYGQNHAESLFENVSPNERDELRRFLLDPKWYVGGTLPEADINKCKALPIYRVFDGGYADLLSTKKYLPPLGVSENLLNDEFLLCASSTEQDVLKRYYGVERMLKSLFYHKYVLSRITELEPTVRDLVMLAILQDLPQLCMEEPSLKESLKVVKFVPTMNGGLESPQMLYDPRVEELYLLLEDADCFPTGQFQNPGVLDMLLQLGLRISVSTDTLIQSARQVESLMHKDQSRAHSRAKVLLSYLELHAIKWVPNKPSDAFNPVNKMFARVTTVLRPRDSTPESELERFWEKMKMICWCPVLIDAPHPALPWPMVSTMIAPPKQVRLQSDMWIVSASSRILDGECTSSVLSQILGWSTPPSGNLIAAQLLELGKNNEIVSDSVLRQELALVMPKIYSLLRNLVGSDEMEIVKAVLEGSRWIWVGDGFAKVDEVVLSGQLHLAPFIRVIPVDLAVFKELFLELGIKEYLGATDYANILSRIATRKGSASLDAQELRMAGLIVQHLAGFQFQDFRVQIFLPDSTSRMCPSTDLVFNDAPWLLDPGDTSGATMGTKTYVHNFVHGNISNDVAEKLGVRSLRRSLLAESADSMNLTLSGVAEAFGQHEALTTRLKHIIDMYADGPGILFELVQNAEDAGASEVVFLLDNTQYGTSSILSPEMAEWQGPALYCFNDSVFSPQDLYAISRIGQDSKLDKPFSIGRFGLGFNCVYHFTDMPGFVSGENIVIFDPHAFYLPGISPSHPGLRIKFVGRRIFEQFPDQFAPFLHFGCDLQQFFPGTLFRFPLRNESAAYRSQIKKEKYTPDDVASLFSSFSQVVPEALLFLRHVRKISLYVKDGPNEQMRLVHHVSRHQSGSVKRDPMLNFVKGNRQGAMNRDQFMNKLIKTSDSDLPWSCQKTTIAEQTPASCFLHSWIISECIGGGNAKRLSMASGNNPRNFSFIPWASLAAYLQSVKINDVQVLTREGISDEAIVKYQEASEALSQERKRFEGRAFCFLPLPVTTSLPVHINAYFELSSNRRDIWMGNDMAGGGKVRSEWNMALLEDVASLAYGRLLSAIAQEVGPTDLFFSLWPTTGGTEPWVSMTRKFYSNIADLGLQVLYTKARGGQWIPTRQSIFPDFSFPKATELNEALTEAGLPLISLPKPVVEKFLDACPSLHLLNPNLLRNLLIRRKRGFLTKEAAVLALEYCLGDMGGPSFLDKLQGLPLIPLANGSFTMFNKRGEGERVFFTTQVENDLVADFVPHLLIDRSIPEGILEKLQEIAQTEESNICLFTCYSLVELFPRILPPEWQRAGKVSWSPGEQGQPSLNWMRSLWCYLKLSNADLSVLNEWPILPIGDESVMQLMENSNVIRDEGWSENMHSLLQKLGCCFLRADLQIDHPQLKFFIQEPTASGVLNAVNSVAPNPLEIKGLFANASVAELHELRSFIFQSKWFSRNQIGQSEISVIKFLPIFESYKSRELTSLSNPRKWLKPEGVPDEILNENFIRTESEKENSILRTFLNIREPDRAEFYRDHVMSRISEFVARPEIISAILADVKSLMESDNLFKAAMSKIPFVSTISGAWAHPSGLYDPRVTVLQNLLHKEAYFPSKEFRDAKVLDVLTSFGLKRNIGYTALLDSARSASILHDSGNPDAVSYSQRLLLYLDALCLKLSNQSSFYNDDDTNDSGAYEVEVRDVLYFLSDFEHDLAEDEFWSEIKAINWCPVCVSPPIKGIPWLAPQDTIAPPVMTRPKSQLWLISSQMHILDGECRSLYLQRKLGWLDKPDVKFICAQLIELSKCYHDFKAQDGGDLSVDAILQKEVPVIYSNLQEFSDTSDGLKTVKEKLEGTPCVYVGDQFVSPKALAFDSPVNYPPYLYVVPSELSEYRQLLAELGVKLTFEARDYIYVLQKLYRDTKEEPLSETQLGFVHRVLEAFGESYAEGQQHDALLNLLLVPDSNGVLVPSRSLVYNDAPWMNSGVTTKRFVHHSIGDDLAKRLGVQSLRGMALVEEELMTDLKCMDYTQICELLCLYGESDFLLFDIIELADYCDAKKVHLIYDKREHPRQSLLQHSLGDYQGASLTVVLEGALLSQEEVCGLHLPPPWKVRGTTLRYGLGLVSSYFVCDLLTVLSGSYFYVFDPLGLTSSSGASSGAGGSAKLFSLQGTDLAERFRDQFHPMHVTLDTSLNASNSTVIRMPLSTKCLKESEENDCKRVKQIFERFMKHSSSTLLLLKSVFQVSLSTWEDGSAQPTLNYSVLVNPSAAPVRNPFSEKKWRKFQLKRLFNSSNAATKMHAIDVHVIESGASYVDKWFVALSLGSGQTRNMALDRRYLAYDLTPVAGVAAHLCRDGNPAAVPTSSYILSPLPLSGSISMPVTVLGHFLVGHQAGRYIFCESTNSHDAIELWNKELMLGVLDSYAEMVLEFQKIRKDPLSSSLDRARSVGAALHLFGDKIYLFWPRSMQHASNSEGASTTDWQLLVEQVIRPFYKRLADLPVWQLYGGNLVRVEEGMFLAQPGTGDGDTDNQPSVSVCSFIKEHYPVFSVPSELVKEIEAVGVRVREIRPRMVRDQLKASSSVLLRSIDTFVDVLEYCLSDLHPYQPPDVPRPDDNSIMTTRDDASTGTVSSTSTSTSASSGGDAIEIVSYFGKALYDFGRGVVEDISRGGVPYNRIGGDISQMSPLVLDLRGVPFPTGTHSLTRLGAAELWIGTEEQQQVMPTLADNFIHYQCLKKPMVAALLANQAIHGPLKLKPFSPQLVSANLASLFDGRWVKIVRERNMPWVAWGNSAESSSYGPSAHWVRDFWKVYKAIGGDIALISEWPLVPAYLDRPVLCRVKVSQIVFWPLVPDHSNIGIDELHAAFDLTRSEHPWLFPLLNKLNIPFYDVSFPECYELCKPSSSHNQSLSRAVVSKLVANKIAGYLPTEVQLSNEDRDMLFSLFTWDFDLSYSGDNAYQREEIDVLRELPIYKTVAGSYTNLVGSDHWIIPPNVFFHPNDARCIVSSTGAANSFLNALGIHQLTDQQVLVRFALPGFENKAPQEQEDILLYLISNWRNLETNPEVINTLSETKFVKNANENSTELLKPKELLDPFDSILSLVFSGQQDRFPGERFQTDGWIRILKKTGLRTSAEADIILECAKKIEIMGKNFQNDVPITDEFEVGPSSPSNEIPLDMWSMAESVVCSIFENWLFDKAFCEKIGQIAFVPAEKGFPSIGGKTGGKRVLCSYKEAILLEDWPLAWSTAPILTKQSVVPPEYSRGAFRLRNPPAFSTVFDHLMMVGRDNGEDTLAHWPTSSGVMSVEGAFLEVLRYLDKIWGTLSSSDKGKLKGLAFIPVANGTRLVQAKSLFARLTINMSPFAFELPSSFLPFVTILRDLDMQEDLTKFYARELLSTAQKSCGYQRLNPNELRAVLEILNYVCSAEKASSEDLDSDFDTVVPDDGCRLVSAGSCVYVDASGSRLLASIDISRMRFVHPGLSENICRVLGIKSLSDVVIEELDSASQLEVVSQIGQVTVDRMKEKLLSSSVHELLDALINSITAHFPSFEAPRLSQIKESLENIAHKLQFVKCLHTRFLLLPRQLDITRVNPAFSIPEWPNNRRHRTVYFVSNSKAEIFVAEPPSFLTVYDIISLVVSRVLGTPLVLPISSLFACPDGTEKQTLQILKLGSGLGVPTRKGGCYEATLGGDLLPQDTQQVQFLPLRPFYKGEIIAWKSGREGEKLKYGKVTEDVKPSANQVVYRLPVETDPGDRQMLLSTQVFSFRSVSMSDPSPHAGPGPSVNKERIHGEGSNPGRSTSGIGNGGYQASKPQYGRVSASEVVQAVNDMLSAVGISFDVEKQALLQSTISLQDQLKDSQVALLVEQEKADAAAKEADVAKAAWSCRICLNSEVDTAMVPCGHVLCSQCSSSVRRCPFCRAHVSQKMKIFRP